MKHFTYSFSALLLILALLCPDLQAQKSTIDYDLSQFKLPYLKRQTLEFDFNSNGRSETRKEDGEFLDSETKNSSLALNLNPTYYYYLNTPKLQINQNASLSVPNIDIYNNKSDQYNSRNYRLRPNGQYNGEIREYISRKFFLEQDPSVSFSQSNTVQNYERRNNQLELISTENTEVHSYYLSLSVPILAGWGRIERVEDARLAVYILDDLQKAGKLKRSISDEDIEALAAEISKLQNERFFDSREKQIWQMEQLDSVLYQMDLLSDHDIVSYTLVRDNWDYSAGSIRNAGFRISGGIAPRWNTNKSKNIEDNVYFNPSSESHNETTTTKTDFEFGVFLARVTYEKPLNLYWQLTLSNTLEYTKLFLDTSIKDELNGDNENNIKGSNLYNSFYASLGYYPNSRTSLSVYTREYTDFSKSKEEESDEVISREFSGSSGVDVNYYLSPRLRLNGELHYYYSFLKEKEPSEYTNNYNSIAYSIGLIYKLL